MKINKLSDIKQPSIYSTPEELAAWTEWYIQQVNLLKAETLR